MLINNISQSIYNELRKLDAGHKAEKEQNANARKGSVKANDSDRSDLSSNGKLQSETDISGIASMVKAQPDIRADKIADAQAKISSGFYNSEEFANKLADKLLGV